jgi:hypothetical protein
MTSIPPPNLSSTDMPSFPLPVRLSITTSIVGFAAPPDDSVDEAATAVAAAAGAAAVLPDVVVFEADRTLADLARTAMPASLLS